MYFEKFMQDFVSPLFDSWKQLGNQSSISANPTLSDEIYYANMYDKVYLTCWLWYSFREPFI